MAFVWIAGPLTGTLVQPYIGIRSDNCRIRWGKRKPFMIAGGAATIFTLLALAWTREIVGNTVGRPFGVPPNSQGLKIAIIVIATILMYCLDFAINTGELTGAALQQNLKACGIILTRNHIYSPSGRAGIYC